MVASLRDECSTFLKERAFLEKKGINAGNFGKLNEVMFGSLNILHEIYVE